MVAQRREQRNQYPRQQQQQQQRCQRPGEHQQRQLEFSRLPQHQQRHRGKGAQRENPARSGCDVEIPPQHPQRRHRPQPQRRRQRETQQRDQSGADADEERCDARYGQSFVEPLADQCREDELGGKAEQHAGQACRQRQQQQTDQQHLQQQRAAGTEAAQDRAGIRLAFDKAAAGERHRSAGDQHRHQCRQRQKPAAPVERAAQRRTRVAHVGNPDPFPWVRFRPLPVCGDGPLFSGQQQAVVHPAGGRDQPGGGNVGEPDQYAGTQAEHTRCFADIAADDVGEPELPLAQREPAAGGEIELGQQLCIGPDLAAPGQGVYLLLRRPGGRAYSECTAQRVARADRFYHHHLHPVAMDHSAGEAQRLGSIETQRSRFVTVIVGDRVVAGDHQVGGERLSGLQLHRLTDPVGEKSDCGHCRHRQHQREGKQAQFGVAPVAPKQPQGEGEGGHAARSSRPCCNSRRRSQRAAREASCVTSSSAAPDSLRS